MDSKRRNYKILGLEAGMILGASDFEYPVFAIYLLEQGISNSEISLLFSLQAMAVFLFEYVTGIIADKMGAKRILILGTYSMMIAELLFIFAKTNILFYACAMVFISFGVASKSGADIASLHTFINKEEKSSGIFEKTISGYMSVKSLWPIITTIAGTQCYAIHPVFPFVLSLISNAISGLIYGTILPKESVSRKKTKTIILSTVKQTFCHRESVVLLALVCIVNPVYQVLSNYLQLKADMLNFNIANLGFVYVLLYIGEAVGNKIWLRFSKKTDISWIVRCSIMGMIFMIVLLTRNIYPVVIILYGIFYGLISTTNVIQINKIADDSNRATMMSQQHSFVKISQTLFWLLCSGILSISQWNVVLYFCCVMLFISLLSCLKKDSFSN